MIQYNNQPVRRQDRLMEESAAFDLLQNGEYGFLSLVTDTDTGYGIPINFVWDGRDHIYLHCAPAGKKLDCIRHQPSVSFCVVGQTQVIPHKFTTRYASIILKAHAEIGLPEEERKQALQLFLKKYAPQDLTVGLKYAEKSFHRTEIIRLTLTEMSGKTKNVSF